ncbi:MAG: phosphoribosylformylglycinamidine synthase subunit PurL [Candidatus Lokiarchaeota archaeon]|nr:phosphoribosylformylglycinamidine synthase subunit PurL [Candidatus Lokiarchaeota archaeon]
MYAGVKVDLEKEELKYIEKNLKRKPNMTEIGMIDIMWSEHCSYKSSRPELKYLYKEGSRVMVGPGQDAGVLNIGDNLALVFKIESHNHPSAIEPYNGAATGIGGIVRDILCMGARPIALVDPLRFGDIKSAHSQWLLKYVVKGIADYGNCIGIPTVAGEIEFDKSFETNCLVNVGCVGIATHKDIEQSPSYASTPGDILILMGGSTGRDGLGGVTFASRVLTEDSEEDRPAVQVGDPFTKKLIIEATLEALATGHVRGLKDLGGGGFTCVCSELAGGGNTGVEIDIEKLFLREEEMIPYEIMLSESQERMMFVIPPEYVKEIISIFEKYEISHAIVGKVTDSKKLIIKKEEEIIVELPSHLLDDSPVIEREYKKPEYVDELKNVKKPLQPSDLAETIKKFLLSPNIASMEWIYRQYDHEVGDRTVVKPGQAGAAVLRVLNTKKAVAIASECNSKHCYLDPYNGTAGCFAEACRNIISVGAEPIGMVDCLNYGNPKSPEIFYQFREGIRGLADYGKMSKIPCIGGNVSFYNEDAVTKVAIKPSPEIMVCGLIDDYKKIITSNVKNPDDIILLIGSETLPEMGGSEYYEYIHELEGGNVPTIDIKKELNTNNVLLDLIREGFIESARDCSRGGIAICLIKKCMGNELGLKISLKNLTQNKIMYDELLFSETYGRYIISIKPDNENEVIKKLNQNHVYVKRLGQVTKIPKIIIDEISLDLTDLKRIWKNAISGYMEAK